MFFVFVWTGASCISVGSVGVVAHSAVTSPVVVEKAKAAEFVGYYQSQHDMVGTRVIRGFPGR